MPLLPDLRSRAAPRAVAVALSLLLAAPAAVADPTAEAQAFVQDTIDTVLGVLRDPAVSLESKKEQVEQLAYERFDFELIARLILGRNRKKLSDQQQADFTEAFKRHLSATYRDTLDSFSDERITIDGAQPVGSRGDVVVQTVVHAASDTTKVDYRLRKSDSGWHGIDVIIEGVSIVQNFRSQVSEIINKDGPDAVIQKLRDKTAEL